MQKKEQAVKGTWISRGPSFEPAVRSHRRDQRYRSLEQSLYAMLTGCAQLAPVSARRQLTTEVCLIPNISLCCH